MGLGSSTGAWTRGRADRSRAGCERARSPISVGLCLADPGDGPMGPSLGSKWSNQHTLVQPTEPGLTKPATSPARLITGPQNLDPRPFGNCQRLYSPPKSPPHFFYPMAPKHICSPLLLAIAAAISLVRRGLYQRVAKRDVVSGTRLRLPSAAAVVSWSVAFSATGFVV
jgi:hypothetical protein